VLATGVNPGFLMDSLPLFLTAICQRVDRIDVTRAQNASLRRGPFQAKVGSGMTVTAFMAKMAEGHMGHVGLVQSMGMLFQTLGKELVRYEDGVEPVVAEKAIHTDHFDVEPGKVRGLKQIARALARRASSSPSPLSPRWTGPRTRTPSASPASPTWKSNCTAPMATSPPCHRRQCHPSRSRRPPGLQTMRDLPIVTR